MPNQMPTDFISGKHAQCKVYFNGQPWNIKTETLRWREVAEEIVDDVNGEDRGRLQKLTSHFDIEAVCYDDGTSSQILQNWLANQANEDANLPQLPLSNGIRWNYLDGTAGGIIMTQCCLGPMEQNIGGRKVRVKNTVKWRARYVQKVATA